MMRLKSRLGVHVRDVRPSNLGVSSVGDVGIRDLGRAVVPDALLERVDAEAPELPDCVAPAP